MHRTLGLCSWSLQPHTLQELFERAQQCSIRHLQIALSPVVSGEMPQDELLGACETARICLLSGMMQTVGEDYSTLETIKSTGGLRPDQHWETNLTIAQSSADLARQLGLKLVTLHAGYIEEESSIEHRTMIERIKRIAEIFGNQGIMMALETGQERARTLMDILDTPGMSHIGINFDPANMLLYNMDDPIEAMQMLKDRITQIHMKDAIRTSIPGTWGTEVVAGSGSVDWDAFFGIVEHLPSEVHVIIEREAGDDRIGDIRVARELAMSYGCVP